MEEKARCLGLETGLERGYRDIARDDKFAGGRGARPPIARSFEENALCDGLQGWGVMHRR